MKPKLLLVEDDPNLVELIRYNMESEGFDVIQTGDGEEAQEELDLVYTATPWEWHAPVMLAAMRAGRHAATEVPMATTLDELWELVETSEKTKRHCVMMENCNYDRTEMMILNMVRQNVFGDLLNAECGYLHDLRQLKLTDYYVGRWRIKHSIFFLLVHTGVWGAQ